MAEGYTYDAPPTCAHFMRSEAFGRIVMGPVGSGKTVSCMMELLRRSCAQMPGQDRMRYTRYAVVRQTLKQLKDTVLKDCQQWLGRIGEWKVSESTFHLRFNDVISEWVFIPLENAEDQARLLSMQLTGAWLSEVIEMDISVLAPISGRMPRYPSGTKGVPSWFGMIADTNFPTEMTPWHDFMENSPPGWQIFRQPSGLAEPLFLAGEQVGGAENLNFLGQTAETVELPINHPVRIAQGKTYYSRFVEMYGEDSDWVKRYVKAQYGDDPSGMAVFRENFRPNFHVVDDTLVIPGYPLIVGQDFGRDPCSLISQPDHMGRLLIHQEVMAQNIGLEKHVNEHLRPVLMNEKFFGAKVAIVGDPAGNAKSTITEESNIEALKRLGLPAFPAPTNELDPRLRAVDAFFSRQVNGGPAILISRAGCPNLVRALSGAYRFAKTKEGQRKPKPDKSHPWSDLADALQYICLVCHGGMHEEIARRLRPRVKPAGPRISPAAWT